MAKNTGFRWCWWFERLESPFLEYSDISFPIFTFANRHFHHLPPVTSPSRPTTAAPAIYARDMTPQARILLSV